MGDATVTELHASRRRVTSQRSDVQSVKVADVACSTVVKLPAWFTVAQARRVAELKRVSHVLVEEHGVVAGAVSATVLGHARGGDSIARWAFRTTAHVTPDSSLAAAERLLRQQGASCLPVVTAGGLLVGTVSIHDLDLARDPLDPLARAA